MSGDFKALDHAMTLEEYRALDAAGKITRPLTWPPQGLRKESFGAHNATDGLIVVQP